MRRYPDDAVLQNRLAAIETESRRSRSLIESMLMYVRKPKEPKTLIDLNNIVKNAFEILNIRLHRETDAMKLKSDLDPNIPPVTGDASSLQEIMINLVENAMDAMPDGGNIMVRTHRNHDSVELSVQDDGPGIPADIKRHIFEEFYTTKSSGHGTGLGLTICRDIAARHHSTLECRSKPGQTVFTLRLPIKQNISKIPGGPEGRAT